MAWGEAEGARVVVCDTGAFSNARLAALHESLIRAVPAILRAAEREKESSVKTITDATVNAIEDLFHNIRTYNAKIRQSLNLVLREDADTTPEKIRAALLANPVQTLSAFRKALKSSALITAEMRAWEQTLGENSSLRPQRLHRIVKMVTMLFIGDLSEKGVTVDWGRCESEVLVDNDLLVAALTHLVDNSVKYIHGGSELRYEYTVLPTEVVLQVHQLSAYIHPDEYTRIWDRGIRGREAEAIAPGRGKGAGLHTVRELLNACASTIELLPGPLSRISSSGKYARNTFRLRFQRA